MNDAPEASRLLHQINDDFKLLRLSDQRRLGGRLHRIAQFAAASPDKALVQLIELSEAVEKAMRRSLVKSAGKLRCEFPQELPISLKITEIKDALKKHQVVIVCGSTGSGKTTQLPKAALAQGFGRTGRIGCTQPRRIAASALARRVAAETGCECGNEVGYKVRFDDKTTDSTVIKFMTDGILLAETRDDPDLYQYDCLILDEVHERSLNIDFLLGYLKLLVQRRRDLRVIISSATLESARISEFFSGAPVIEVEGMMHPVEDCFMEPSEDEELSESIARAVDFLTELDPAGDTLVFLPGEREIRDCSEFLEGRRLPRTEILPLFGRLSGGEQQKVFSPGRHRRIILATNVAETSLTIPGIRFVIDSGLVRLSRYNPRTRIQELRIEFISQASARQRRGRCGRVRDGVCVHLYSEENLAQSADYTAPEIQRSSLAGVILQMAALRLPPIDKFPLVDPPAPLLIREGYRALVDIKAVCEDQNRLTNSGWQLAAMHVDPHLGKMLIEANAHKVLPEMVVIVAFLSIQDPRERPFEQMKAADSAHRKFDSDRSDFIAILNLWQAVEKELAEKKSNQALRRFAEKNFINFRRLREWRNLVDDLIEICDDNKWKCDMKLEPDKTLYDSLHKALLSGLPRQLGRFDGETKFYSDMGGKKFILFPASGLAKRKSPPQWILSFALVETSRVFARCNAEVNPEWLEHIAPHLCTYVYDNISWDEHTGFVHAREIVTAGQLVIHPGRRRHYAKIAPVKAREIFIREALVSGMAKLHGTWLDEYRYLLTELKLLEVKIRRPDSIVDIDAVYEHFNKILPQDTNSIDSLKKDWNSKHTDYCPKPEDITTELFAELREEDYPDSLVFAGQRFSLSYAFDHGEEHDGITLTVPEDKLNIVSPHALDYLVPGWLQEKIELMIKSLPKSIRRELMPISDTAASFMSRYRDGKILSEQPLADALADFLNTDYGMNLGAADFDNVTLPEYLKMKLALTDSRGNIRKILREFPAGHNIDSRLSASIPAAKKWQASGCAEWPGFEEMPLTVEITKDSGTPAYPALADEETSVGRRVYLKENEAKTSHERGIARLFRLKMNTLIKQLKNGLKVSHRMELSFFMEYRTWQDDLLDSAIREALGGDLWHIRSGSAFEIALEKARGSLAAIVTERLSSLQKTFAIYEEIQPLLRKLPDDSPTREDVKAQLDILFRPGFLRTETAVSRYSRYMKALHIRVQRAIASPAKDDSKGEFLELFVRKFNLAATHCKDMSDSHDLCEFFLLLEEARISAYAPEIKPLVKCGENILREKWDALRLA